MIIIWIGTKPYWYSTWINSESLEQDWPNNKDRVICLYLLDNDINIVWEIKVLAPYMYNILQDLVIIVPADALAPVST